MNKQLLDLDEEIKLNPLDDSVPNEPTKKDFLTQFNNKFHELDHYRDFSPPRYMGEVPAGKPSFINVTMVQHNSGYWHPSVIAHLAGCFENGIYVDFTVKAELMDEYSDLLSKVDIEILYTTLLGIYVLTEVFPD